MNRGSAGISASNSLYTYNIRILSVKMKVKFQCKMKIQLDSESITNQVATTDGLSYVFNQDYALVQRDTTQNYFTLSVALITNKGAKYIAGLAQIYHSELARAADTGPSSRIVITLSKCLDPQAILQIVVIDAFKNGIKQNQSIRHQSRYKKPKLPVGSNIEYSQIQSKKMENSPPLSPRVQSFHALGPSTRSQIYLPKGMILKSTQSVLNKVESIQKRRSRSRINGSRYRQKTISAISIPHNSFGISYTQRDLPNYDKIVENSPQRINTYAYQQSYAKLKQKLRRQEQISQKQHQKRVSVESNEANTKIQALKYRLRCQQLQQNVMDKNGSIKKLQLRIQQLERLLREETAQSLIMTKSMHANSAAALYTNPNLIIKSPSSIVPPIKIYTQNNDNAIASLQSKVSMANQQLQQLRNKIIKINRTHLEKQNSLNKQLQYKNTKILQLQQQIVLGGNKFASKNQQILKINLENQNKIVLELQKQHQQLYRKLSDADKVNRTCEKNNTQLQNKIEQLNKNLKLINSQKIKLMDQIDSEKNKASMAQFSTTMVRKNMEKVELQLSQMQKIKQKYHDSLIDIKKIQGQRRLEQKNFENMLKTAQNSAQSNQQKFQQQIDHLNKKNQELESRCLQQSMKIKQLQTYINTTAKSQLQNYRRLNDRLQKQCEQYKNNERISKKQYITYQTRMGQSNSELQIWKNKFKSLENVHKLQSDKYMNEIGRMKISLEQQMINQLSLKEKNQSLSAELAVTANKLGMLDQKYSKEIRDLNQKVELQINKNNKLQEMLKKQEIINMEIKDKEKHLKSKIQEYGENQTQFSDLIKRYQQQVLRLKGTLGITQEKLSSKVEQADQLAKQIRQTTQKYNTVYHKNHQLAFEVKNLTSQLQKNAKQISKMEYELTSLKANVEGKDKVIQKQKNNIQLQLKQKNQAKQELSKAQMNLQNTVKQYDRFRDYIYEVLVRQFTGVDGLESMANFVFKNRQNNMTLRESLSKNGVQIGGHHHHHSSRSDLRNSHNIYTNNNVNEDIKLSKSIKTFGYPQSTNSQYPMIHSPSNLALNNNDIVNTINQFSKQSKALLNKMIEQYRYLEKQYEYSRDNFNDKLAKYNQQTNKSELNIHKLQDQIAKIYHQKEHLQKKFDHQVTELHKQNIQLKQQLEKKKQQLDESIFTCNGIKMEKQTEKQYYESKILQNSTTIHKLNNAIQSLTHKLQRFQQDNSRYKFENEALFIDNRKFKQDIQIRDRKTRQLQYEVSTFKKMYQQSNIKSKQLLISVSDLQLQLTNEKQKNGKNMQIISQQEKKMMDTKQFINNLIKQKQTIVKQDITNGNKIIELQSVNMNITAELSHIKSSLEQKVKELSHEKDNTKKLNTNIKQIQSERNILKQNNAKLVQQLKLREKQVNLLNDHIKNKDSQYSKQLQNRSRQLSQLNQNKELMSKLSNQQVANLRKEISRLEEEVITALQQQIRLLNNVLQSTQRQLQSTNRNLEQKIFEVNSYKQVQQRINGARQKLEGDINSLMDQIRQKDEQTFNISGQLYSLQQKYTEMVTTFKLDKQKIQEQFDYKYDAMCEDYETKLDEIEKQRDYLKQKLLTVQQELRNYVQKVRNLQYQEGKQRTISKDRIVKIQQQKNAAINSLKIDLKRAIEQKDRLLGQQNKKQIQLQKLRSEEKADKNMIQKLQIKIKQCQLKLQQCQTQIYNITQVEKKKQIYLKQYQQSVSNYQWILQRQIKKQLQNVTKYIVSANTETSEGKKKIAELLKQVENRMSRQVGERIVINNSM